MQGYKLIWEYEMATKNLIAEITFNNAIELF